MRFLRWLFGPDASFICYGPPLWSNKPQHFYEGEPPCPECAKQAERDAAATVRRVGEK